MKDIKAYVQNKEVPLHVSLVQFYLVDCTLFQKDPWAGENIWGHLDTRSIARVCVPMAVCKVCQAHKKSEDKYVKYSRSTSITYLVRERRLKLLELDSLKNDFQLKPHILI